MNEEQELRAQALELAIRHLALYPPLLDNIYNNSLNDDAAALARRDGFFSEITRISAKYEDLLKQA